MVLAPDSHPLVAPIQRRSLFRTWTEPGAHLLADTEPQTRDGGLQSKLRRINDLLEAVVVQASGLDDHGEEPATRRRAIIRYINANRVERLMDSTVDSNRTCLILGTLFHILMQSFWTLPRSQRSMNRRLFHFALLSLLILAVFELSVRQNEELFSALSDRIALRMKIFERSSPDLKILFIGTSRFVDAIDQSAFSTAYHQQSGNDAKSLNVAIAGMIGEEFQSFAELASQRDTLEVVVLEASYPSLLSSPGRTAPQITTADSNDRTVPADTNFSNCIETALTTWISHNVGLVRNRKALRPNTLSNLFYLYSSNYIDPAIWSRRGTLVSLFENPDLDLYDEIMHFAPPRVIQPDSSLQMIDEEAPDEIYINLKTVSNFFKDKKTHAVWVAPPLSQEYNTNESDKIVRASIARDFDVIFIDYTGINLPDYYFRDSSHLNKNGRAIFTRLLARDLAKYLASHD